MSNTYRSAAALALAAALGALSLSACSGHRATDSTPLALKPAQPNPAPDAAWQGAESPMAWWRDARFGMFIHWGLYSIAAGEWGGKGTNHAEWIRDTAQIPVGEYEKFKDRFNAVKFDANAWTAAAKQAGMKYICITTKHHDGFCLFDTKYTDWSVAHTPFKRDIMREMADACRAQGVVPCWYHSIMDWHHPDYLPRRPWEAATRGTEGADFDRYNTYLKNQVTELLTNYGPIGVMWFDGQWEGTWTHPRGEELYKLCKTLQPDVIVNNRVDKGGGNFGMTRTEGSVQYCGDYGTPEQEIPPTGMAGVDWETCMTMNDHWGYNAHDHNFKTTADLLHKLADIASKGGNFLLNVGPTAEGEIPAESLQRLKEIGAWMDVNGEAIHGTQAGPFGGGEKLAWGRCTMKPINAGIAAGRAGNANSVTRLYLHVFDWPKDGRLVVPGIFNTPRGAFLLSDKGHALTATRGGPDADSLIIDVPTTAPDAINSVVVLDIEGKPDVSTMPRIDAAADIFVSNLKVRLITDQPSVDLHYTLDGSAPAASSPKFVWAVDDRVHTGETNIDSTTNIATRAFRNGKPVSPIARRTFTKVTPIPAISTAAKTPGMTFFYHEGDWNTVPNFTAMKPAAMGIATSFDRSQRPAARLDKFGFRYHGYLRLPTDGAYTFWTASDDGSNLYIDGQRIVNNDGLHSLEEKSGTVALAAGLHAVTVDFFEKGGGHELDCWYSGPNITRKKLDPKELVTEP